MKFTRVDPVARRRFAAAIVGVLLSTLFATANEATTLDNGVVISGGESAHWQVINEQGVEAAVPFVASAFCSNKPGLSVFDAWDTANTTDPATRKKAFDNGAVLFVNGAQFLPTSTSTEVDVNGRTLTTRNSPMSGLNVNMQYYAAADSATLRTVANFQNPSTSTVTATVSFQSNSGADGTTIIPAKVPGVVTGTSNEDSVYDQFDRWVITGSSQETSTAVVTHVLFGPGDPSIRPSSHAINTFACPAGTPNGTGPNQGIRTDFSLPVPGNATVSLMFFHQLNLSYNFASKRAVETYNSNATLGEDRLLGLNSNQLSKVVNWKFPVDTFVVVGPGSGSAPVVTVSGLDVNGTVATDFLRFQPFNSGFSGGVAVATGDINGDLIPEIATGAGPGGGPHVKVFELGAPTGTVTEKISFFPYDLGFRGGVQVAFADVDKDESSPEVKGVKELITGAGPGGGPHIRVWKFDALNPTRLKLIADFFAFDVGFTGGVSIDAGDVIPDIDDRKEIVVGAGPGGGPHVRIFRLTTDVDSAGVFRVDSSLVKVCGGDCTGASSVASDGFFPYSVGFNGGVHVAVGDVDKTGFSEIVTGAGPGGGPHVRIFKILAGGKIPADPSFASFFPFPINFSGGVRVASRDTNGDGRSDVIAGAGPGGGPNVHTYAVSDGGIPTKKVDYFPYPLSFTGGVWVSGLLPTG